MGRIVLTAFVIFLLACAAVFGVVASGRYNVAADVPHTGFVHGVLERLRVNSIRHHARDIETPADLADGERIRRGAGNYDAMCVGCHLAPGMASSEISRGLYPHPPNLSTGPTMAPAEAFWVIRHGLKASGMPGWGHSMEDAYIWDMVALLQVLPGLSPGDYRALVDASPGHSHGGGEGMENDHHGHGVGSSGSHEHHDHPEPSIPASRDAEADGHDQHDDHDHDHKEDQPHAH